MTTPDLPGFRPSPFDPTPWPPWDKVTAAGAGELYGAMARRFDEQAKGDGFTRAVWAKTQLAEAVEHGTVTAKDAQRLSALTEPGPDSPSARQLFDEALADPESTPTSIGLLSLAQYIEEHTETDEISDFELGLILGFTGGSAVAGAIAAAKHLHIRVKIT